MKKAILFVVFAICMMNISCGSSGSSGSSSSGSTAVTIRLGASGQSSAGVSEAVSSSALPSGVAAVRITVSADDMVTIIKEVSVAGQSSVTITLDIPNGPNRRILVEALNAAGSVLYSGETIVNLNGEPVQVTISMSPSCGLFVDETGVDESDCTDSSNPCRSIYYALTQTNGNITVCVAAGLYDIDGGEDFPLTLLPGMTLKCNGANHTTIIDSTVGEGSSPDTIIGAAGATIEGCRVKTGDNSVAISDNDAIMTVNDCVIEGTTGYNSFTGISLSTDSTVSNSTIRNFPGNDGGGEGILVAGGSPVISGNILQDNYYGIYVEAGAPVISGNTIGGLFTDNAFGIYIVTGTAPVTGNTITYNSEGVRISGGDPVINNNTLSCNSGVDLYNQRSEGTIDARNNRWDAVPPVPISECSGVGEDICTSGGAVDSTGAMQAPACIELG